MADEALKAAQAAGAFQSAVGGGELHFPVGAAAKCATYCNEFGNAINDIANTLAVAQAVAGMGGLESGHQLQAGFREKALLASQFLKSYADSVKSLGNSFRAAEAGYVGADADAAGATEAHTAELGR